MTPTADTSFPFASFASVHSVGECSLALPQRRVEVGAFTQFLTVRICGKMADTLARRPYTKFGSHSFNKHHFSRNTLITIWIVYEQEDAVKLATVDA